MHHEIPLFGLATLRLEAHAHNRYLSPVEIDSDLEKKLFKRRHLKNGPDVNAHLIATVKEEHSGLLTPNLRFPLRSRCCHD